VLVRCSGDGDGPVQGFEAEREVQDPAVIAGGMNQDFDCFADHLAAVIKKPSVFDGEAGAVRSGVASDPADEPLADSVNLPQVVALAVDQYHRPHPGEAAVMIVVLGEVVGEDRAVGREDRVEVGGPAS
jgi:hypothetical protein